MKATKLLFFAFALALLSGCSTGIVSMGKDTYMVEHRGSSLSTKSSNEAKCLNAANKFCAEKGLVMIPISTSGRDGLPVPFGHGGDCQLIFRAVPPGSPLTPDGDAKSKDQSPSLGQQLIDLQKAKAVGAITDAEYEAQKAKLLGNK